MVGFLAFDAECEVAHRAHLCNARLLHDDGRSTRRPGAVHHIGHSVKTGLEQEAIIATEQLLSYQSQNLCRCRGGGTVGLRTGDTPNVSLCDLEFTKLTQTGLAEDVATLVQPHTFRTETSHKTNTTVKHCLVKYSLSLRRVIDQNLGQENLRWSQRRFRDVVVLVLRRGLGINQ